jgi:hypothetical protein
MRLATFLNTRPSSTPLLLPIDCRHGRKRAGSVLTFIHSPLFPTLLPFPTLGTHHQTPEQMNLLQSIRGILTNHQLCHCADAVTTLKATPEQMNLLQSLIQHLSESGKPPLPSPISCSH